MIQVTPQEITEGMVIARTVYRETGDVLMSSGFRVTPEVKVRLAQLGLSGIWVQEEGLEDILPEEIIPEYVLHRAAEDLRMSCEQSRKQLQSLFPRGVNLSELMLDPSPLQGILQIRQIRQAVRSILGELRKTNNLILHINSGRTQAHWLYQHATDSALVAAVLGRRFAFNDAELEDLAFGTMCMDLGYLLLPETLVNRNGRLTFAEFNAMKEHPTYGYEMLRLDPLVPLICAHIALQHHERQDGGGYPRRLVGRNQAPVKTPGAERNQIHRYAEIASIADEYLTLSQPKFGTEPKAPIEVIKSMLRSSGTKLNSSIVDALIPLIPLYSVGTRVVIVEDKVPERLGHIAVVSATNRVRQDRPQIALLFDKNGNRLSPERLNLEEHPTILVREIRPGVAGDVNAV